jgi:small subunit ribosomal protein S17
MTTEKNPKAAATPAESARAAAPAEAGAPAERSRTRKIGKVVSAKMQKTVVVEVERSIRHGRYGKFQKRSMKFLADDRVIGCKPGDVVEIEETRPLSAKKRWRVKTVITQGRRDVEAVNV